MRQALDGSGPWAIAAIGLAMLLAGCNDDPSPSSDAGARGAATATGSSAATVPAPAATAGRDAWTGVMEATPEGGFRLGNPDAEVKLLEFASLACPHCREFHEAAMEPLKRDFIAPGKVSYELRTFVLNGPDFAVTLLARCQGPAPFFRLADDFLRDQQQWMQPFLDLSEAEQRRLQSLPPEQQMIALADAAKLDLFMRQRGMPRAKFEQCLTSKTETDKLAAIRRDAIERYQLSGTPTFVINGEVQKSVTQWSQLEPRLTAALR